MARAVVFSFIGLLLSHFTGGGHHQAMRLHISAEPEAITIIKIYAGSLIARTRHIRISMEHASAVPLWEMPG
jgi:hypothetical protein